MRLFSSELNAGRIFLMLYQNCWTVWSGTAKKMLHRSVDKLIVHSRHLYHALQLLHSLNNNNNFIALGVHAYKTSQICSLDVRHDGVFTVTVSCTGVLKHILQIQKHCPISWMYFKFAFSTVSFWKLFKQQTWFWKLFINSMKSSTIY